MWCRDGMVRTIKFIRLGMGICANGVKYGVVG